MTNNPLKLGYKASAEQFGPRQLLNFAIEAEECGFDSVWVSDHFQPWRHTGGHAPRLSVWLAPGERTEHVSSRHERSDTHVSVSACYCCAGIWNTRERSIPEEMILGVGSGSISQMRLRLLEQIGHPRRAFSTAT